MCFRCLHTATLPHSVLGSKGFADLVWQVRKAQISIGDREVYTNEQGEPMSRLREVNSDWIIRGLERWGQKVCHCHA